MSDLGCSGAAGCESISDGDYTYPGTSPVSPDAVRARLDALAQSRVLRRPLDGIHDLSRYLDELQLRAVRAVGRSSSQAKERLAGFAGRLESLSPLAVLARGYSLTQRSHDGHLITDARQVATGDQITTRFARGQVHSRVEQCDVDD